MILASLLVHTQPDVAARQAVNVQSNLGADMVAVHVSQSATFDVEDLKAALAGTPHVSVNPVQRSLEWGRILDGHHENLRFLGLMGADDDARVYFHASNDWYLRPVRHSAHPSGHHNRPALGSTSLWTHDPRVQRTLNAWAQHVHHEPVLSQCEGSWYPLRWATQTIEKAVEVLSERMHAMPAEEYVLPTAAGAEWRGHGLPHLLSEVTRKDALVARSWARYLARTGRFSYPALRVVHATVNRLPRLWALREEDLLSIQSSGSAKLPEFVNETGKPWRTHQPGRLAAGKRIPVDPHDPLRIAAESLCP